METAVLLDIEAIRGACERFGVIERQLEVLGEALNRLRRDDADTRR